MRTLMILAAVLLAACAPPEVVDPGIAAPAVSCAPSLRGVSGSVSSAILRGDVAASCGSYTCAVGNGWCRVRVDFVGRAPLGVVSSVSIEKGMARISDRDEVLGAQSGDSGDTLTPCGPRSRSEWSTVFVAMSAPGAVSVSFTQPSRYCD